MWRPIKRQVRKILFLIFPYKSYLKVTTKIGFTLAQLPFTKYLRDYEYIHFIRKIIKKGDVCIDIGANVGYYTCVLAEIVGPEGKVYAVEPIKPILNILINNVKKFNNIVVYPFALGKENKIIRMGNRAYERWGFISSGSYFIIDPNDTSWANSKILFEAEMRRATDLFSHLKRVDFIKCDVEGYEVVVLTELEGLISKFKPIVLVESFREKREKVKRLFEKHGYYGYVLQNGKLFPASKNQTKDILFVHPQKIDRIKTFIASY